MTARRLVDIFAEESEESFERLMALFLDLEAEDASPAARQRLRREVQGLLHGAKGGAMVVPGLGEVGAVLHAAESYLVGLPGDRPLARTEADLVLAAIEACRRTVRAVASGATVSSGDLAAALSGLGGGAGPPAEGHRPDAASTGAGPPPVVAAPSSGAESAAEAPALPGIGSLRVSVSDVDALLHSLTELSAWRDVLARRRSEVEDAMALLSGRSGESDPAGARDRLDQLARHFALDERALSRAVREALDAAERFRLQACGAIFESLRRAARDVVQRTGKRARLVAEGADVLVDKRAVDALRAPLIHLVRNAIDHGVESPERRAASGKEPEATVRVSVSRGTRGVRVEVSDDGGGVDEAAVRARAVELGLPDAERRPLLDLIGSPGLSTRATADEVSGRGVGVAAVRDAIERLGGHLSLETRPGAGTTFALCLPATFATRRGLRVEVRGSAFYVPAEFVERLLRARPESFVFLDGRAGLIAGGVTVPVLDVGRALGLRGQGERGWRRFVLVRAGARLAALEVDRILGQQEILVRPLRWPLRRGRALEGLAAESDGTIVPILDVPTLLRSHEGVPTGHEIAGAARESKPRVLIVDDSVTTRSLERSVLEGAGFEVRAASDGREALEALQAGETFDLVISDVEMPRLDGIGLVVEVRKTRGKADLPILLVTSLDQDVVRVRGMDAGANALLLKQAFDPESLLAMVRALLAGEAPAGKGR